MTIDDIEVAKSVIAHEAVDCFLGREQKATKQPRKLVSCTGGVFWGKPGETWPQSADGRALIPWLQIVCTEMERLYGAFYRKQVVCFFLDEEFDGVESKSAYDGNDFVVREYALDDELEPLQNPGLTGHPFHRVTWQRASDYPSLSKYYDLFSEAVYDKLAERRRGKEFEYSNQSGIKIGGWPTPIQRDQEYPGTYDLQIDMTENYMYADSGIGYLSKSGDAWYVLFECC